MSLNLQDSLSLKRETFRCSIRRTAFKDDLKKQRASMQHTILMDLSKTLNSQDYFDATTFRSLLQMTQNDQQPHYILLANYMKNHIENTALDVFQAFKERRSEKVHFAHVVRLSLQSQMCVMSEMLYNIHSFVGSQDIEVVKQGLSCILLFCSRKEYNAVLSLDNFKKIIHEHLFSQDPQVSRLSKYIMLALLLEKSTVQRVVAKGVGKPLLYLLGCNRSRKQALDALQSMFEVIDLQLGHQELLKQLVHFHYTESGELQRMVCNIWLNFVGSQPISKIVLVINMGLQTTLGDKLSHLQVEIQSITLKTIQRLYQRLSGEHQPDILYQIIYNFEEGFGLSNTLIRMQSRSNKQVQKLASSIFDGYYTYNTDDYVE